jgi:hypothetical protein
MICVPSASFRVGMSVTGTAPRAGRHRASRYRLPGRGRDRNQLMGAPGGPNPLLARSSDDDRYTDGHVHGDRDCDVHAHEYPHGNPNSDRDVEPRTNGDLHTDGFRVRRGAGARMPRPWRITEGASLSPESNARRRGPARVEVAEGDGQHED